jgi:hypothetical protein
MANNSNSNCILHMEATYPSIYDPENKSDGQPMTLWSMRLLYVVGESHYYCLRVSSETNRETVHNLLTSLDQ